MDWAPASNVNPESKPVTSSLVLDPSLRKMAVVPRKAQQPRADRHMFSMSDDIAMIKQIQATHAPDGREFPVKSLLVLVEYIFRHATKDIPSTDKGASQADLDDLEEETLRDLHEILQLLSYPINKVSTEIAQKSWGGGGDLHATTLAIFNILSSYSWDAKVALALATFAMRYGEFWLVVHLRSTNPLAKNLALVKQLEELMENLDLLKQKFAAISNLITALLNVAKIIVEFKELPAQYVNSDMPEIIAATAHIPTAAYWIIRSIVACSSQLTSLTARGPEYMASTTETWELLSLAHKVNHIHKHLQDQLTLCRRLIDEKKHEEAFQLLVKLFATPQYDNLKVLKQLLNPKDDQPRLIEGSTKMKVNIEVLKRKYVMLLITDLDVPKVELVMLREVYQNSKTYSGRVDGECEVVWLPVVDSYSYRTEEKQKQFSALLSQMPWYSVSHPHNIDPSTVKYIKEVWGFNKNTMLVVLDPQGRVANTNAIHMIWIWNIKAYPFTISKEEELWRTETWNIEFIADSVEQMVFNWIRDRKYICLYGGEDIEWIRKFTKKARAIAAEMNIPLEMLYVGKRNAGERVGKNIAVILEEKLSHTLFDKDMVSSFWLRLQSVLPSRGQGGKNARDESIVHETITLLTFDGTDQCWALISKGSVDMVRAKQELISKCLEDYEVWKKEAEERGLIIALRNHLNQLHSPLHCNRLILPSATGIAPDMVECSECGRLMEKFLMYRCCVD